MRLKNIGNARNVNEYVKKKIADLDRMGVSFGSLFELMFSEESNIISETYSGLKVIKKTYGECKKEIIMLSDLLLSGCIEGLPESRSCGIYMSNSVLWIEVFWALIISGIKPLLLNLLVPKEDLSRLLTQQKVGYVICDSNDSPGDVLIFAEDLLERAKSFRAASGGKNCSAGVNASKETDRFEILRKERGSATHIILMTSGTSQNIKLCFFDAQSIHDEICYSYEMIRENRLIKRHYRGELKHLCFLPFYHIFGLVAVYMWFSFYSRTFVFLRDIRPDTLLDTVRLRRVTHVFAVPLFWEKIYDGALKTIVSRGDSYNKLMKAFRICDSIYGIPIVGDPLGGLFSKLAFKEVRDNLFGGSIVFMISGGGHIRPEVLKFFNYIGYRLVNGYGMTETGITSVELRPRVKDVLKGTVGRPLRGVSFKIDEEGILWVKGSVMARIIVENGVPKENDGWFRTFDLASEKNGRYSIEGRADDVIVLPDGENVNPEIVEKHFDGIGFVNYCIVKNVSEGAAFIGQLGLDTDPLTASEMKKKVKETAAKLSLSGKITDVILTFSELKAETDFKVSRKKIREKLKNGEITDVSAQGVSDNENGVHPEAAAFQSDCGSEDKMLREISLVFAETLSADPDDIYPDTDFFRDLSAGSLDYYQMIRLLEERFSIDLSGIEGRKLTTCRIIKDHIQGSRMNADGEVN